MRAHEKMLLNSKLMKAIPYVRHYGSDSGCAIGMIEGQGVFVSSPDDPCSAENLYPWLRSEVPAPCGCPIFTPQMPTWTGVIAIVHLFNDHVCAGDLSTICSPVRFIGKRPYPNAEPWTIERLADYIKSIDPTVDQDEELVCESEESYAEVKA